MSRTVICRICGLGRQMNPDFCFKTLSESLKVNDLVVVSTAQGPRVAEVVNVNPTPRQRVRARRWVLVDPIPSEASGVEDDL